MNRLGFYRVEQSLDDRDLKNLIESLKKFDAILNQVPPLPTLSL